MVWNKIKNSIFKKQNVNFSDKLPGVHNVYNPIFKPTSFLLEEITTNKESDVKSCVVGGVAVQTILFEQGAKKYCRDTPDVDMVASDRLSRGKFRDFVSPSVEKFNETFEDYQAYIHTKGKQNTIVIHKLDFEDDDVSEKYLLHKGERMIVHYPRYSKKAWEEEKHYDLKATETSEFRKLHGHVFKCSNVETTVEGKIRRLYDKLNEREKVEEEINKAYKKIERPEEFKLEIDLLRFQLGNAFEYETNCKGFVSDSDCVSKYRDRLSVSKDTYDLAALWKVTKIDDLIMQKVEELNKH